MHAGRIAWIDHTKGLGIILVVMSVAALGYGTPDGALNWMQGLAAWADSVRRSGLLPDCRPVPAPRHLRLGPGLF